MTRTTKLVREFHLAFGHPVETSIVTPSAKVRLLRFRLILEELMEFGRAIGVKGLSYSDYPDQAAFDAMVKDVLGKQSIVEDAVVNLAEAADALGDIDYVTAGANLVFGFPDEAVTTEIHRANMSKLGEDGKPIYDEHGKIQKGPNYAPPDVARVLQLLTETKESWSLERSVAV